MAGSILYVDDDPGYQNSLGSSLERNGFIVDAACNKDQAMHRLQSERYDLLLVNLHLGPIQNYFGEDILAYALENCPQIPRVLITGDVPLSFLGTEQMKALQQRFSRYKLAEFCEKRPDLDVKKLSTRIGEIIAQGGSALPLHPTRKVLDRPYTIREGVSWDILKYLGSCNVLEELFTGIDDYLDYLYVLLAGPQPDQRYVATHHLWKGLWIQESWLPYFDLISLLIDREIDGTLYRGYRDHVVHSLLTYLLGLYLYYGNKRLRDAMAQRFSSVSDFRTAWKIAALFHDIGYIWSADPKTRQAVADYFLQKVDAYFRYPLHLYCEARGIALSERDERHLRLSAKPYIGEVRTLDELRKSMTGGYPLKELDELVKHTSLVADGHSGILERYDSFSKTTFPAGMTYAIEDHGILSALLLMCQFEYFEEYAEKMCAVVPEEATISKEAREQLRHLDLQAKRHRGVIREAAAAIALHNINVDIWDHDAAKEHPHYLTFHSYQLSLEHTPLAFLLALTDVLQCWDRPRRTEIPRTLQDCAWQSEDVRILCRDEKIEICFLQDPKHRRCTDDSLLSQMLIEMGRYMKPDDLSMILEVKEP